MPSSLAFYDYGTKVGCYTWDAVANDWVALPAAPSYSGLHIAGATTTLVKSGAGTLRALVVNRAVALSVITVYDSLTAGGTVLAVITNAVALLQDHYVLPYDVAFAVGLTVVTSAADDLTVVYR